jgi:Mycothiol maleylpyruvate isomerase N-terminal domain
VMTPPGSTCARPRQPSITTATRGTFFGVTWSGIRSVLRSSGRRSMLRALGVSESAVEMTAVRAALLRVSDVLCTLVASAANSDVAVPGSDWNVSEVTAHLAVGTEAYVGYLSGVTEPFVDVSDIAHGSLARTNAAQLDAEPERQLAGLAQRLRAASSALIEQTEGRDRDEVVAWHGQPIALGDMLGIGLAEYMLHGRDIAALSRHGRSGQMMPGSCSPRHCRCCPCSLIRSPPPRSMPATTSGFVAVYGAPCSSPTANWTWLATTNRSTAT